MDPIHAFRHWLAGEILQGKVMLTAGLSLSIALLLLARSTNVLLRGMSFPLAILIAMNLGYGSFLVMRSITSRQTETAYQNNVSSTAVSEIAKGRTDAAYYASARPVWAGLSALSLLLFILLANDWQRGFCLGLAIMFTCALLIDSFLHFRLLAYVQALQQTGGLDGLDSNGYK